MGWLFGLIFCGAAYGEKYAYPEQKILATGVEAIQISGVKGHITLRGRPGKVFRLKVKHSKSKKFEDWSLAVDRRGNTLYFEVSSVAYGAQWRRTLRRDLWPEFDVELSGPSKPTSISWREGDLEFRDWTAAVESSSLKGNVSVRGGSGNYNLQTGTGNVDVENLAGELSLKGESGRVQVDQLTGGLNLTWITGEVSLKNVMGGGQVELSDSQLKISTCQGDWSVNLARGKASVEHCSGKLKAQGESSEWQLQASVHQELEVKSQTGPVAVRWKSGGANVFLTSDHGDIRGPKVQAKLDGEGRKVAQFKVGTKPFNQVFVRTQSGPIVFK